MSQASKPKRTIGRPSKFSQATADTICERLADAKSLRSICLDETMPSAATVCRWLADERYSSFREQYTRAREAQADAIFDEILHIADTQVEGERIKIDADGNEEITREDMLGHRRLQIDARKWMAGKLAPKKYGDKLELDHKTGGEPISFTLIRQPDAS